MHAGSVVAAVSRGVALRIANTPARANLPACPTPRARASDATIGEDPRGPKAADCLGRAHRSIGEEGCCKKDGHRFYAD